MTPQEIYDIYRKDPQQDMYDYSPLLRFRARGNVVEIGVRGGVSTAALLLGIKENGGGHVYSIDIDPECGKLFDHPQWTFVQGDSAKEKEHVLAALPAEIDILFVDGDHRYAGLMSDLETYSPLVKRGGLILVHDVIPIIPEHSTDPGCPWEDTRLAYQEFVMKLNQPHFELPGKFGMGMIYV